LAVHDPKPPFGTLHDLDKKIPIADIYLVQVMLKNTLTDILLILAPFQLSAQELKQGRNSENNL